MFSQIHQLLYQRITAGSQKHDFWIAFNAYVHLDIQFITQLQLVAKIFTYQTGFFWYQKKPVREWIWRIPLSGIALIIIVAGILGEVASLGPVRYGTLGDKIPDTLSSGIDRRGY